MSSRGRAGAPVAAAAIAWVVAFGTIGRAHAQALERSLAARVEVGGGTVLGSYQRESLGLEGLAQGTARLSASPVDALALQASAGFWFLPTGAAPAGTTGPNPQPPNPDHAGSDGHTASSAATPAGLFALLAGARFEPRLGALVRPFVDASAGVGFTGPLARLAIELGAGVEFSLAPGVAVGPVVRYARVFAAADDAPFDATFLSVGATVTLRPWARGSARAQVRAHPRPIAAASPSVRPAPALAAAQDPICAPDASGCTGVARLDGDVLDPGNAIAFEYESDALRPQSEPALRAVALAMRQHAEIARIRVEAHTDDRGDGDANLALSQRRAEAVVRALVVQYGIAPARLEARGYGATRPLVPERTVMARAANRRVEFHVVAPPGGAVPSR